MKEQKGTIGTSSKKMEASGKKKLDLEILKKPMTYSSKKFMNSKISMKVNKIVIKIQSEEDFFKELDRTVSEVSEDLKKGIVKPVDYAAISFTSLSEMRSTFSPNRLKLLSAIKKFNPHSIYELSKILKRDRRHIMKDIKALRSLGVLKVKKSKLNGRKTSVLTVPYDEVDIAFKI